MAAYFDIYRGESTNYSKAREISRKYVDYPVQSWRLMFTEILDQLAEVDGEVPTPTQAPEIMEKIKDEKQ